MEIGPVSSSDEEIYETGVKERPHWEKLSLLSTTFFSLIAFAAFIPAFAKKKRSISLVIPGLQNGAAIEIAEEDPNCYKCSLDEKKIVEEIITTVARKSVFSLAFSAMHLRKLGKDIEHIHTFAFLHSAPKIEMRMIFEEANVFKTNDMMNGIIEGLKKRREKLAPLIPSFAADMGKSAKEIQALIHGEKWKALIHYLYDVRI